METSTAEACEAVPEMVVKPVMVAPPAGKVMAEPSTIGAACGPSAPLPVATRSIPEKGV